MTALLLSTPAGNFIVSMQTRASHAREGLHVAAGGARGGRETADGNNYCSNGHRGLAFYVPELPRLVPSLNARHLLVISEAGILVESLCLLP